MNLGYTVKSESPHVHFICIGGAGMGAIANILLDKGYLVSGSDVASNESTQKLASRGAKVYLGHAEENVEGADYVVYSTALAEDNVELGAARAACIPVMHRSEMLAHLMSDGQGIAVAGAHGKTTTTSMVTYILVKAGLDPTFLVGGVVANLNTGAKAGAGKYVVAEADESDGSFLNYRPTYAIVTNIEADHLEHYGGQFANLKRAYRKFMQLLPTDGLLVTNADDEHVRELLPGVKCAVQTYSVEGRSADLQAKSIVLTARGSSAEIFWHGEPLGTLRLAIPGRHNVGNALAALAVAVKVGVPFAVAATALTEFHGALRRFQVIYEDATLSVIDDYAHHPTEIKASIGALKASGKRIVAVFQPQRYTRTFHLFDEFTRAFAEADDVIIADIYSPAGELPIAGVSAERLSVMIRENSNATARFCATNEDVLTYLKETIREGDLLLTMGAGDIWKVGVAFAAWHQAR